MYSVVLMMALSSGATTPAAHGCDGCWGGHGCSGYASSGCNGGCHGGKHGLFRRGCDGGGCNGGKHGWFGRRHGCNGCNGGCHGGGGCWGSACHGGYGCAGSACHGGHGCAGCTAPAAEGAPKEMPKPEKIEAPKKATEEAAAPAPATIMVTLPADAKLTIDDYPTTSTSSPRRFNTPTLERGKDFTYMLKAEIQRDGRTLTTSQMVTVRAGEESRIELQFPVASVAQK